MGRKNLSIPAGVSEILCRLQQAGEEGYLVGGCVRDWYMGIPPHDYDITTSALPQRVAELFADRGVIETGIAHGTVTVRTADGPVEVTTYRQDGDYSDHRHPDQVSFTRSLREDLARRDFTMNAMAMDAQGALQDPFHGQADIDEQLVRCVGEADRRFEEDALRILRGLRFAARLGFALEPQTAAAMHRKKELLKEIAAERVFAELCGLLQGDYAAQILQAHRAVLEVVLPEMGAVEDVFGPPTFGMARLLAKAQDPAKPLARLKAPNAFKAEVLMLIENQQLPRPKDRQELYRLAVALGAENLRKVYAYQGWDDRALEAFLAERPCLSVKDLAISGKDLLALGYQGPAIGKTLEDLLRQIATAQLPNTRESLLKALKK